jgi:hypothetical protein
MKERLISHESDSAITLPRLRPPKTMHKDEAVLNDHTSEERRELYFIKVHYIKQYEIHNRKALEKLAVYFMREIGHDCQQVDLFSGSKDEDKFFIFSDSYREYWSPLVIGGCSFRHREYSNHPPVLSLEWIWFHPYYRDKGILSAFWPAFRKLYGDFAIDRPLSSTMKGFLKSKNECCKCGRDCKCQNQNHKELQE